MSNPGFGHNQPPGRWIALDVGTLDHPVVGWKQPMKPADPKKKAASKCEAWIDLIRFARWKAGEANNKGHTVYLERGEMMASLPFLADRWNWTVMQVRWFIKRLESEMMVAKVTPKPISQSLTKPVTQNNSRNGTIRHNFVQHYRIENYELYQTARELEELTANSENNSPDNRPATGEQQESIPRDTTENNPPCSPPKGQSQKRAHRMPDGWMPKEATWEWAKGKKIGATDEQIREQIEHFRDHAEANGKRFVDWDKGFQTWMRNAKQWGRLKTSPQRTLQGL